MIEDFIQNEVYVLVLNAARQTTAYREEARSLIMSYVNAQIKAGAEKDVLVFCGAGATGAIHKFIRLLELETLPDKAVVFVGEHEHHSNLLPWRAVAEVVTVPLLADSTLDVDFLRGRLRLFQERSLKIGAFSAASNLTGILQDTDTVTELLHQFGALACWDYAAASPYVRVDMNPVLPGRDSELLRKDAIFLSPHKLVGGIGTPGVLVAKKRLFQRTKEDKKVPHDAGGGTVFFVTGADQVYDKHAFVREEAGTPDIVGCIRAGLTFRLKHWLGEDFTAREHALWTRIRKLFSEEKRLVLLGPAEVPRLPIFCFLVRHGETFLHHNFVGRLLSDLFGIQSRSGCMCAGPYAQQLLGLTLDETRLFQAALVLADENEWVRPGFTRLSLPFFAAETEVSYVLEALSFLAEHAWKFLPQYSLAADTAEFSHFAFRNVPRWFSSHIFAPRDSTSDTPAAAAAPVSDSKRRRTDTSVALTYEALIAEAHRQLEECERAVRHMTAATTLPYVNNETAALKWCLFPSEALLLLRKQPVSLQPSLLIRPNNALALAPAAAADEKPGEAGKQGGNHSKPAANPGSRRQKMTIPKKQILIPVRKAMTDFEMLQPGDRILLGLSGGKDSLTLLHVLLFLKRTLPVKFELGVCTIDPGSEAYDPRPLKAYVTGLGLPYFFESERIMDSAMDACPTSICSWCARMKRGTLYTVARREGYNVLALGQHLDDMAESFLMSAFHNGKLRTMKAHYRVTEGDIRVVRPLAFVREEHTRAFATTHILPVISENCPACFEVPKERKRIKTLLATQEQLFENLFPNLLSAMRPLMFDRPEINAFTNGSVRAKAEGEGGEEGEEGAVGGGNGLGQGPSLSGFTDAELRRELERRRQERTENQED